MIIYCNSFAALDPDYDDRVHELIAHIDPPALVTNNTPAGLFVQHERSIGDQDSAVIERRITDAI
jgi:hypothetical protein